MRSMSEEKRESGRVHLQPSVDFAVEFEDRSDSGGCRWDWDGEVETTASVGARLV